VKPTLKIKRDFILKFKAGKHSHEIMRTYSMKTGAFIDWGSDDILRDYINGKFKLSGKGRASREG